MFKVLCILADIKLPVYQNAHVKSVSKKVYSSQCLFYFSVPLLTFVNKKGNIC